MWKLTFQGEDGLTAYVHTEASSLAAVNNHTKNVLQGIFRALHSWEWVPERMDWLRVVVMALMVGSLLALAVTGIAMLVAIRRRKRLPGSRGWRRVAGYVLGLPLIMFAASGIYHLVQSALVPPGSQLRMGAPLAVADGDWPVERDWTALSGGRQVTSMALVEGVMAVRAIASVWLNRTRPAVAAAAASMIMALAKHEARTPPQRARTSTDRTIIPQ